MARQHLLNQPRTFPVLSGQTYRYETKIRHTKRWRWEVGVVNRARHFEEMRSQVCTGKQWLPAAGPDWELTWMGCCDFLTMSEDGDG